MPGRPQPRDEGTQVGGTELARSGLAQALEALEAGAECVGTSGYNVREDVLLATTSPDADKLAKGA